MSPNDTLTVAFWQLYKQFETFEEEGLQSKLDAALDQYAIDNAVLNEFNRTLRNARQQLDWLIQERLTQNDRSVPLISPQDASHITVLLRVTPAITGELIHEIADLIVKAYTVTFILDRAEDHYDVFWQWVRAVTSVAQRMRHTPEQAIQLRTTRAKIFAAWITPEYWTCQAEVIATTPYILPPSILIPTAVRRSTDPSLDTPEDHAMLLNAAHALLQGQLAGIITEHFTKRAKDIWSTT